MRSFVYSAFLAAFITSSLGAQDTEEFNPLGRDLPLDQLDVQIRIQFEWIEMPHVAFTALMEDDEAMRARGRLSSNASPLRQSIKKLVEKEEARILETVVVIARSGQRAKVESITEFTYPTEYDPPATVTSTGENSKEIHLAPQATAFETRNLGVTVEVDPIIGADNRTIDLNMAPEIVYLVDEAIYGSFESDESQVEIEMPTFYTMKTTTQVTMIEGEPILIGVHSPFNEESMRTDPERKVLLFAKSDILYVGLKIPEEAQETKDRE